jgi:high frequency lysogenization protein
MDSLTDQTLAMASMIQSALLINQLAHGEPINQAAFDCSVDSLFTLDAQSSEDIYGHGEGLITGLRTLDAYLSGQQPQPERVLAYYLMSMIKIERKLVNNPTLIDEVQAGFKAIQQQAGDFEFSSMARIHHIDGLYQRTLSQIKPRIIVQGEQSYLSNPDTTGKIRALLFAGIRATVLWRQRGGSRLKLLFARKKLLIEAGRILSRLQH